MFLFSSCGAECNTTLYIYDYCNMANFDDTNEGAIYFDDMQGGCGEEASLTVLLEGGQQYWIRFASLVDSCGGFDWAFDYAGLLPAAQMKQPAITVRPQNSTMGRAFMKVTPIAQDRTWWCWPTLCQAACTAQP